MNIKQRVRDIINKNEFLLYDEMRNLIKNYGVKETTLIKWKIQLYLLKYQLPHIVEDMVANPSSLCPYCYQYINCNFCPVKEKTGKRHCGDTGYKEFLFSLRQYTKDPRYSKQKNVVRQCRRVIEFIKTLLEKEEINA